MVNCLNCGKKLTHIEGRRPKKFCNDKCKGEYWRKENGSNYKPKRKHLTMEEYEELLTNAKIVSAKIVKENNKPVAKFVLEVEGAEPPRETMAEKLIRYKREMSEKQTKK